MDPKSCCRPSRLTRASPLDLVEPPLGTTLEVSKFGQKLKLAPLHPSHLARPGWADALFLWITACYLTQVSGSLTAPRSTLASSLVLVERPSGGFYPYSDLKCRCKVSRATLARASFGRVAKNGLFWLSFWLIFLTWLIEALLPWAFGVGWAAYASKVLDLCSFWWVYLKYATKQQNAKPSVKS